MIMLGKATIARITAERLGFKDPKLLKLIERLAGSAIELRDPEFLQSREARAPGDLVYEPCCVFKGTMDGKDFSVSISGPAFADFA